MYEVKFDSWFEFVGMIMGYLQHRSEANDYRSYYRGQANADWPLNTTLERNTGLNLEVGVYCNMIEDIQPTIESFTNKKWELPKRQEFLDSLINIRSWWSGAPVYFHYMSYLRHFGFPTPLLDWTHSPFIAAYFAFRDITSTAKSVAIYSKMEVIAEDEKPNDVKPQIYPIYANTRNNTRHYLQQSIYTVCLKIVNGKFIFSSHEDPYFIDDEKNHRAYIMRYIIPASERARALHSLDAYNINAYSLFGSEESLLETIFMRRYIDAQRKIKYHSNISPNDLW